MQIQLRNITFLLLTVELVFLGTVSHGIVRFRAEPSTSQWVYVGLMMDTEGIWIPVGHCRSAITPVADVKVGKALTSQTVKFVSQWSDTAVETDPLWRTISVERKKITNFNLPSVHRKCIMETSPYKSDPRFAPNI